MGALGLGPVCFQPPGLGDAESLLCESQLWCLFQQPEQTNSLHTSSQGPRIHASRHNLSGCPGMRLRTSPISLVLQLGLQAPPPWTNGWSTFIPLAASPKTPEPSQEGAAAQRIRVGPGNSPEPAAPTAGPHSCLCTENLLAITGGVSTALAQLTNARFKKPSHVLFPNWVSRVLP